MAVEYRIYASPAAGEPVDYTTPVATVSISPYELGALGDGEWRFAVHARDDAGGREELNHDEAVARIVSGVDVTAIPAAVRRLTALARSASSIEARWLPGDERGRDLPTDFDLWATPGESVDYGASADASVPFDNGMAVQLTTLTGLTPGTTYTVGVKARNATGSSDASPVAVISLPATAPSAPDSLTSEAI